MEGHLEAPCEHCRSERVQWRRVRDGFRQALLNVASHELRTPLTPIMVYLRTLEGLVDEEDHPTRTVVAHLRRNADRLKQVIDDFLDAARIESGELRLRYRAVDLATLASAAVANYEPQARRKHLTVIVSVPDLPRLKGDPVRLQQVLDNLVANAIKATPARGQIRIEARPCGDGIEVTVSDTGCGFDGDSAERLFEPFGLNPKHPDSGVPTTGLGLSICRAVIEAHGGQISGDSRGVGEGAAFRFTLPLES